MERKNAWTTYSEDETAKVMELGSDYRDYLDRSKTERECAKETVARAEKAGYKDLDSVSSLKPGDRIYVNTMGKAVQLYIIGEKPIEKGLNIVGAHIDSPRMDIKQNPMYEDSDLCYLDTHYYGGIKKYQWVALPLALHGVVAKKDGSVVDIAIGEDDGDPVVGISDLLIHLSATQLDKKGSVVIEGEDLDVIVGGMPLKDAEKDKVKSRVLQILKDKYGFEEEDFLSAEIEVVPAGRSRDFGLDRSMVIGYGHDDRVCAYAELDAMLGIEGIPEYTCCCILADKEEIGSVGATGMQAKYFENAVAEIMDKCGDYSELKLRKALASSKMLSCDVSAGFDPSYAYAFEKKNAAFLGRGVCFNKFTGSRGKGGSNDANAEYIGKLRAIMDENSVSFQTAEIGKVDQGGGGTIAFICALYGMNVIDSGVPVLSMHAPWEIISKADLYEAVKAYKAFLINA
ncbi:MAG: aminopeptidase [Christensenellaceae bacterium]|nr:aminopeptidase [Christensenellaceae bacterium]